MWYCGEQPSPIFVCRPGLAMTGGMPGRGWSGLSISPTLNLITAQPSPPSPAGRLTGHTPQRVVNSNTFMITHHNIPHGHPASSNWLPTIREGGKIIVWGWLSQVFTAFYEYQVLIIFKWFFVLYFYLDISYWCHHFLADIKWISHSTMSALSKWRRWFITRSSSHINYIEMLHIEASSPLDRKQMMCVGGKEEERGWSVLCPVLVLLCNYSSFSWDSYNSTNCWAHSKQCMSSQAKYFSRGEIFVGKGRSVSV